MNVCDDGATAHQAAALKEYLRRHPASESRPYIVKFLHEELDRNRDTLMSSASADRESQWNNRIFLLVSIMIIGELSTDGSMNWDALSNALSCMQHPQSSSSTSSSASSSCSSSSSYHSFGELLQSEVNVCESLCCRNMSTGLVDSTRLRRQALRFLLHVHDHVSKDVMI